MKTIRWALVLAIGFVGSARTLANSYDLFSAQEYSLDLLGFYASRDKGGSSSSAAGTGVGFNYFFTQNFGVGADTYADAFTWPYLLNANGIFRFPIPRTSIAPYAFAGFGREWWHAPQWMGDVGGGIEYRPCNIKPLVGLFADVRGVFPTETRDYAVVRFGFRLVFR